jgi:hypothetical protein
MAAALARGRSTHWLLSRWWAPHHPAGISAGLGRDRGTAVGITAVRTTAHHRATTTASGRRRRRGAHLHVPLPRLELLLCDGLRFGVLLGLDGGRKRGMEKQRR